MRRPRQLRQNLFLHFAEPRLWLKLLQLTVKVRSFEGRPHGCSSAAFRWVWHFLKVVRLPSDQRWTFGTQVIKSNQITFIVTSPQHKCLGEWNSYERAPDSAKKTTTTIYIWTVHIYRLYRRQCAKYTYIYSVHIVYYKDILNYQLHIIHRMYTSTLCTLSIHYVVYT